jgi:hypothetical protein
VYLEDKGAPADTKKAYLDHFVKSHINKPKKTEKLLERTSTILQHMAKAFTEEDALLRSVGMNAIYFLLFREYHDSGTVPELTRIKFGRFEKLRAENRVIAEEKDGEVNANSDLLEFDRLTQSPNDKMAIQYRLKVLRDYLEDPDKFKLADVSR